MSYMTIKWSYMSPRVLTAGLNGTELSVLRALCWLYRDQNRTPDEKNCFASRERIGELIGKDTDTVDRAKATLKNRGLIDWFRTAYYDDKGYKTNSYIINCPELTALLERNAKIRKAAIPPNEDDFENMPTILNPGQLYIRTEPSALISAFTPPLSQEEAQWMSDALAFVCDKPENRHDLHAAMLRLGNLEKCQSTLRRVVGVSNRGRKITNRLGYLLKALKRAATAHSK